MFFPTGAESEATSTGAGATNEIKILYQCNTIPVYILIILLEINQLIKIKKIVNFIL